MTRNRHLASKTWPNCEGRRRSLSGYFSHTSPNHFGSLNGLGKGHSGGSTSSGANMKEKPTSLARSVSGIPLTALTYVSQLKSAHAVYAMP